jgi:hypothetical protein
MKNKLSAFDQYQLIKWVEKNKTTVMSMTDEQIIELVQPAFTCKITSSNISGARRALGFKKHLNADEKKKPIDKVLESLKRIEDKLNNIETLLKPDLITQSK